ncbi:MAG: 50S ribosomal protein L21 [Candidatus Dadabacteria bacterium]|nr:50S ribosomal protein L21 [Candidatus Dadabacteria bacterium]
MIAVLKTGAKQYRVKPGDVIDVEKLPVNPGESVEFSEVLLVADDEGSVKVGTPFVDKATVKGKVLGQLKGPKIIVFKFKRRKGYRKKQGHRQKYTSVEILEIST